MTAKRQAPPHLVIDSDPGLDDVVALAVLAADVRASRLTIGGFMAVAGNVGRDRCAANARLALDRLGLETLEVAAGADRPIGGLPPADAGGFHGGDGLAGLAGAYGIGEASALPVGPVGPQCAALIRAAASDRPVDVLTLGPLTDLALALEADADLGTCIGRVVSMGGGFGTPTPESATSLSARGNVTQNAEFNVYADPVAADRVFAAGLDLTLVPLDVTRRVQLDTTDADAVERANGDELVVALLRAGIARQQEQSGLSGMAAHDPLAALAITEPEVLVTTDLSVIVGRDGDDRGACRAADDGRPAIKVALDVDVDRAHAALLDRLTRP